MKYINKKTIFVTLFALLYLCVGLVSTIHAVSFFGLANTPSLGIILAITFEIGQAAVLFNLLTSPSQRKRIMPWALMCILTLVQILGNIFSSYKYLITNSSMDLKYFKEPIFTWVDLPDQQCNVIITYIVGAILPIVALCLTEMVVSYLNSDNEAKLQTKDEQKQEQEYKPTETPKDEHVEQDKEQEYKPTEIPKEEHVEQDNEQEYKPTEIPKETTEAVDDFLKGPIKQDKTTNINKSHFINI